MMTSSATNARGSASGFTLTELLIVVIILGLLAVMALQAGAGQRDAGVKRIARKTLWLMYQAEKSYISDAGVFHFCPGAGCGVANWTALGMGIPDVGGVPVTYFLNNDGAGGFVGEVKHDDGVRSMSIDEDGVTIEALWP